jgi:hypothetical protein
MQQEDVPQYIGKVVPELRDQVSSKDQCSNIYQAMHLLLDFTNDMIHANNFSMVERCFALAEKLYTKGNHVIKGAVENVYVFALDQTLSHSIEKKEKVRGMLPDSLYSVYVSQIMGSNI